MAGAERLDRVERADEVDVERARNSSSGSPRSGARAAGVGRLVDAGVVDQHGRRAGSASIAPQRGVAARRGRSRRRARSPCRPSCDDRRPTTVAPAPAERRRPTPGRGRPSAPVTTATAPGERRSARRRHRRGRPPWRPPRSGAAPRAARRSARRPSQTGWRSVPPDERSSSYGGSPSPGDFSAMSSSRQHVPGGQVARGDELLGHLDDRRGLARVHRLRAVAERDARALQVAAPSCAGPAARARSGGRCPSARG